MIFAFRLFGTLLLLISAQVASAVGSISVSGSIPRDTSLGYFDVTITVTEIQNKDLLEGEVSLSLNRIRLFMKAKSESDPIPFEGQTQSYIPFIVQPNEPAVTDTSSGRYTFEYKFRVVEAESGALKEVVGSGSSLLLNVAYYEKGVQVGEQKKDQSIAINTAVAKDAPTGFLLKKSHESIIANWTGSSETVFTDSKSYPVSNGVLVVIAPSATPDGLTLSLPAKAYDTTKVADESVPDGSCVFDPNFVNGASCVSCTAATYYLDTAELKDMESVGIRVATTRTPSAGNLAMTELTNGVVYAAFMYYEPSGLTQTSCYRQTPEQNFTLSELNGEDEAKWDNPRCFIATAAYGSTLHRNLAQFTWLREHVLLKTKPGKQFVKWYYTRGPALAEAIAQRPMARFVVRTLLWPAALGISLWREMFESKEAARD
jgi:hypothetical protein